MGALLIVLPPILFGGLTTAALVPMAIGLAVIVYSLMTAYELSIAKLIPMQTHLVLDILGGLLLAVSPWLFGFADVAWAPHVVLGVLELGAAALTFPLSANRRLPAGTRHPAHGY
jgi:hypothetical protein